MAKIDRECYFDLLVSDQADVLQSLAPVMGRRAEILEKDIWLCQVLDLLFQLPCRKPMAFKGGTSLSKVYKVIDRTMSEQLEQVSHLVQKALGQYSSRLMPSIRCAGSCPVLWRHW